MDEGDWWRQGMVGKTGKKIREGLSEGWKEIAMRGEFRALATRLERI